MTLCAIQKCQKIEITTIKSAPDRNIVVVWGTPCVAVRICTAIIVPDAAIVKGKFAMAINNRVGGRAFFESQTDASQTEFACWLVSLPQSVSLATGLAIFHPSSNGTPCGLWL